MDRDRIFNRSLFEICQAMVSSLDLNEVLDTILTLSLETFSADAGSILLFDADSDNLRMLAAKGLPPGVVKRGHVPRKGSITEQVLDKNHAMIVNSHVPSEEGNGGEMSAAFAIKSALCVPLRAKGEIIGTLNLNRYDESGTPYGEDDLETVAILASQAAVCIENARLHKENLAQARMAAIGQTVAGISHCIKNMLTGLRGGIGLAELAQQSGDWGANEKALTVLRRNIERVSLLVLDMLDYSKDKTPSRRDAALENIVDEVFGIVSYKAEKDSVALVKDIAADCRQIFVDPNQVFRCLLNLVENAMDAVHANGQIAIRARELSAAEAAPVFGEETNLDELGRIVRICVEDDGDGIEPGNLEKLFEPFFSTKASKGTGLGLAVTRKIILEHGGRVVVESEPGRGTSFFLIIPECSPEPALGGP